MPNNQPAPTDLQRTDNAAAAYGKPRSPLRPLSDYEPVEPRYLWEPYIRDEQINIVRGNGGTGKSMLLLALAAAVTRGTAPVNMPGLLHGCERGASVLYFGAEDDSGELAFRAQNCGVVRDRLFIVPRASDLPTLHQPDKIRDMIHESRARLVIFDPLQSFLGAKVDANRANEVRPLLDRLREIARESRSAIVIVEHQNKASQQAAIYRGIGSIDVVNASRSVLLVGWHPRESGCRVMCSIKANAACGQPVKFAIDNAGRFSWRGLTDVDPEIVAVTQRPRAVIGEPAEIQLAREILRLYPNGWNGSATELLRLAGSAVQGRALPTEVGLSRALVAYESELAFDGIAITRRKGAVRIAPIRSPFDEGGVGVGC